MKKWITALMISLTFFVVEESEVKAAEMYVGNIVRGRYV